MFFKRKGLIRVGRVPSKFNFLNEISGINPQKRADFAKKYLQSTGQTEKTVNYSNK